MEAPGAYHKRGSGSSKNSRGSASCQISRAQGAHQSPCLSPGDRRHASSAFDPGIKIGAGPISLCAAAGMIATTGSLSLAWLGSAPTGPDRGINLAAFDSAGRQPGDDCMIRVVTSRLAAKPTRANDAHHPVGGPDVEYAPPHGRSRLV